MIGLLNNDRLHKEFQNISIQPIETFIGEGSDISLKAANNTEVNIKHVVTLNLSFQNTGFNFAVPFIVRKEELLSPILGFNFIEHLIQISISTKDHTVLENIFPSLDSLKIESVFDVIKNSNGEFYGSVYNST